MIRETAWAVLACAAAASVSAQPAQPAQPAPDRGAMLYETHCITCHTEQVHWRERKLATDWDSLRRQVWNWQGVEGLGWTDDDVNAVARHLNRRYYGFEQPSTVVDCAVSRPGCAR